MGLFHFLGQKSWGLRLGAKAEVEAEAEAEVEAEAEARGQSRIGV